MVMRMIRGTVTRTANFNIRDLCPIKHADRTFIPALFVAGLSDDFIQPHHRWGMHVPPPCTRRPPPSAPRARHLGLCPLLAPSDFCSDKLKEGFPGRLLASLFFAPFAP